MLTIDTGMAIANSGQLKATTGGTLVVDDAVTGTGSETIGDSGVLVFKSSVSSGQTVTFTRRRYPRSGAALQFFRRNRRGFR